MDFECGRVGAYRQLQTYKEAIPEMFRSNGLLIASDGVHARMESLSADQERFTAWRTIDGVEKDQDEVRAKLRLMVKTILKKWNYPPDGQDAATGQRAFRSPGNVLGCKNAPRTEDAASRVHG